MFNVFQLSTMWLAEGPTPDGVSDWLDVARTYGTLGGGGALLLVLIRLLWVQYRQALVNENARLRKDLEWERGWRRNLQDYSWTVANMLSAHGPVPPMPGPPPSVSQEVSHEGSNSPAQ